MIEFSFSIMIREVQIAILIKQQVAAIYSSSQSFLKKCLHKVEYDIASDIWGLRESI